MQIRTSTRSELGSFCAWSGSELDSSSGWSGSKLVCGSELVSRLRGVDRSDFRRVLGVDRSLFRRLCGVDRSLDRLKWLVWSGSELGCVDCIELGSWCVGVDHSVWLGVWVGAVKL